MAKTDEQNARGVDNYRQKKYNLAPKIAQARASIDGRRRKRALKNLYEFLRAYGPGALCTFAPPKAVKPILDEMERAADSVGGRYQIMMSRGFGKTTFLSGLAWLRICRGETTFVEIIGATDAKAEDIFDTMVALCTSETFAQDFPEASVPLRESGGNSIYMSRFHWDGKPVDMEKKAGRLILPTVPDSPISGAKIVTKSFTAKDLRGLKIKTDRPDLILLDDIQTDELAANPAQISKAMRKINQTIRGQFAPTKLGPILVAATPIFPGDVCEQLKDSPAWITSVYPMMKSMPTDMAAWAEYRKVLEAEIAASKVGAAPPKVTANAFYRKNRKRLDAGAVPLAPHVFDPNKEVSAVQHAMNIIYGSPTGEEDFETEYQMKPRRSQSVYNLDYKTVLESANGVPCQRIPDCCVRVFASIDVMNTAGLRWAVMATGAGCVAAVVNYGRYPADNSPLFNQEDMFSVKAAKVANAIDELTRILFAARFKSADGSRTYAVGAIGIDCGWMNRTVVGICNANPERLFAMKGIPFSSFAPRTRTGQLAAGVIEATDWMYSRRNANGTFYGFHADFMRETAQRGWFNAPLSPSSLSVFGRKEEHLQFAQECVADQLVQKDKMRSGDETWKWSVGGPNHLGDCVTMCVALAYWRRAFAIGGGDISGVGENTPVQAEKRVSAPVRRRVIACL